MALYAMMLQDLTGVVYLFLTIIINLMWPSDAYGGTDLGHDWLR